MPGIEAIAESEFDLAVERDEEGDEIDAIEESRLAIEQIVLLRVSL